MAQFFIIQAKNQYSLTLSRTAHHFQFYHFLPGIQEQQNVLNISSKEN